MARGSPDKHENWAIFKVTWNYTWTGICTDSKLIVSWVAGKRDALKGLRRK